MKKKLLECYKNYFGSGNPEAKYWILGFEPGGNPLDNEYMHHLKFDNEKDFVKFSQDYSNEKVEPGLLTQLITLLIELGLKASYEINPTERKISFSSTGDAFYANLFLLKFPSEKNERNGEYLEVYKEYFEIEVDSALRNILYPETFILQRQGQFMNYLMNPKTIFVLKKGWNEYYFKLLGLNIPYEIQFPYDDNNKDQCDIYRSGKHLIVFMKNGRFSYDGISQVLRKIDELYN